MAKLGLCQYLLLHNCSTYARSDRLPSRCRYKNQCHLVKANLGTVRDGTLTLQIHVCVGSGFHPRPHFWSQIPLFCQNKCKNPDLQGLILSGKITPITAFDLTSSTFVQKQTELHVVGDDAHIVPRVRANFGMMWASSPTKKCLSWLDFNSL